MDILSYVNFKIGKVWFTAFPASAASYRGKYAF
jgi:hypothetical protein